MRKMSGRQRMEFEKLHSSRMSNPRVLNVIVRIMRALLWFLDRSPKIAADSRHCDAADVHTVLNDLPEIIIQENDAEKKP